MTEETTKDCSECVHLISCESYLLGPCKKYKKEEKENGKENDRLQ